MTTSQNTRWHNWSGSVQAQPRSIVKPKDLSELARLVGDAGRSGRHIRVVGAGHSFTPLAKSDDILLDLEHIQGLEAIDETGATALVLGGTRLKRLGDELLKHNLAQENLGDIDVQSISGAISTGTHGTGIRFGNLATQVVGLTLVTASGELLECSAEQEPEIFKAAQISLGMLGVIARVKLRLVPAKRLHFISQRESVESCLENLERYKQEHSHFEFFWLPHTKWAQAKFGDETEAPVTGSNWWSAFNQIVLENGLYWVLSECCRLIPNLSSSISQISAMGVAKIDEVDYSHNIFATPRAVRFQEMEYNLPAEHFTAALREIQTLIHEQHIKVHFPIECRFARADDIWLSPAYQRDSAYIAVHMYRGMEYKPYFRQVEAIFQRYDGRPHWGKMHTLNAETLASRYPRWEDFRRVRALLDPQGIFLNDYLRQLFNIETPASPVLETTT